MSALPVRVDIPRTVTARTIQAWLRWTAVRHEHEWRLRAVDHEDGVAVSEYVCDSCQDVQFR